MTRTPEFVSNLGANVLTLREAGVTLLAGTDTGIPGVIPGAGLHEELKALVATGIPASDVLKMATSVPADVLEPGTHRGVIDPGAPADLLLVRGDPTQNIADLDRIVGVWQQGERVDAVYPDAPTSPPSPK
jgi:imidazolonepropionase-like amidohydrolase